MVLVIGIGLMLASGKKQDEPKPAGVASSGRQLADQEADELEPAAVKSKVETETDTPVAPESDTVEAAEPDATETIEPADRDAAEWTSASQAGSRSRAPVVAPAQPPPPEPRRNRRSSASASKLRAGRTHGPRHVHRGQSGRSGPGG